jgi:dUTP pyrophosphatase
MKISGKTNNISYAHTNDGGADLRSNEDTIICAGSQTLVHTGVHMAIPAGYVGLVCPRSGLALKHDITVMNAPGVIDANYRGEVCVILRNMGEQAFEIHEGDRIAQIVFLPYAHMQFEPVNELDSSERGEKGFGSSGIK